MSDSTTATTAVTPVQATPKKPSAAGKNKKPRVKPNHPRTSEMVNAAIKNLKERGGSSLQAIKKYISANYKVDAEKLAPFIKKYLKSAVTSGSLTQTKGKGASGSFKLSGADKGSSEPKKATTTLGARAASGKKPAAKKLTKKPAAAKPAKAKKVAKTPTKKSKKPAAASPSKAKKPAVKSSPAKKPKTTKAKKATAKPAKKTAPKKK